MENKMKEKGRLVFLGTFPPPIHGMSIINQAIFERLAKQGWQIEKYNTSPQIKNQQLLRISRVSKFIFAWKNLLKDRSLNKLVYIAISGGWGQLFDVVTMTIIRLLGIKCIIHHHSSAYLTKKRWVTQLLFNIAKKNTIHVVLCEKMRQQLLNKYGCERIFVLSNLAFFPFKTPEIIKKEIHAIGYLSNITVEKGGREIIELARIIHSKNKAIRMIVAGPCQDKELTNALLQAEKEDALQWYGAIYNTEKQKFWKEIDVFIFPTNYKNEAEPLVIWEAISEGIPVISNDRGCIRCQIGEAGKVITEKHDFVIDTLSILELWMENPTEYQQYASATTLQYESMREISEMQFQQFLDIL
jgi:glycosyltransferase involved in cell wall biosynthesis